MLMAIWASNAAGQTAETIFEDAVQELVERFADERDQPWRFTFEPNGRLWWWQNEVKDRLVYWDTGADVQMEVAAGRGHRIWIGGIFREAVGYGAGQTVTPLDPRHIDVAETIAWRWKLGRRFRLLTYWERWCYHEVDIFNAAAIFFTQTGFGGGTFSPMEQFEPLLRARKTGKPWVDYWLFAGPTISGGYEDIMGWNQNYNGEARARVQVVYPVTRTLVLETQVWWNTMLLYGNASPLDRHRGGVQLTFAAVRDRGAATFFIGRRLKDTYLDRRSPVSNYLGMMYRF